MKDPTALHLETHKEVTKYRKKNPSISVTAACKELGYSYPTYKEANKRITGEVTSSPKKRSSKAKRVMAASSIPQSQSTKVVVSFEGPNAAETAKAFLGN